MKKELDRSELRSKKGIDRHGVALEARLIEFAVRIIGVVESLTDTKAGKQIAGQLIRSGTFPAPNYGEAQSAESRKDFVHKMKIALKELRESHIWLQIIREKRLIERAERLDSSLLNAMS